MLNEKYIEQTPSIGEWSINYISMFFFMFILFFLSFLIIINIIISIIDLSIYVLNKKQDS